MADPLSLGLAIGGGSLLSGLMGMFAGGQNAPTPEQPKPQAPPASAPMGSPNTNKPKGVQSFMSAAAPPTQGSRGTSSLLGA